MARKKGDRIVVSLKSTDSGFVYTTQKNKRNDATRVEQRKYDPTTRRHIVFREAK